MTGRLFSALLLFLFLLACCKLCGVTCNAGTDEPRNTTGIFKTGKIKVIEKLGNTEFELNSHSILSSSFFAADGLMVAFAAIQSNNQSKINVDIIARHIDTEGNDWVNRTTEQDGANWETQLIMEEKEEQDYIVDVRSPVAIAKDNKIYLLITNHKKALTNRGLWKHVQWDFELAVGEIKLKNNTQGAGKTIEWETSKSLNTTLTQLFKNKSLAVPPYGGPSSAFLPESGEVVFVTRATRMAEGGYAVIRLNDTAGTMKWDVSYIDVVENCYSYFFFQWEQKIMMFVLCLNGNRKLKESANWGRTWEDSVGTLSLLTDQLQDKKDFITAEIDNKSVLLFTQAKNITTLGDKPYGIYLWVSDGNRMHNMGIIITDNTYISSSGLVYTKGELFFMYSQWNFLFKAVFITRLKDKLEDIRSLLRAWTDNDKYFSQPCNDTAAQCNSSEIFSFIPMPTAGLVAFLGDNGNGTTWRDEYRYVDATVEGATKVPNGFTFYGPRAGAKWPVERQWQMQQYNFPRRGLTVVATVTVHNASQACSSPLLTIDGANFSERMGLWYDESMRWRLVIKNVVIFSADILEKNKPYRVVLLLEPTHVAAFVDGVPIGSSFTKSNTGSRSFDITNIFIGGYDDDCVNTNAVNKVTFRNVFLYNRPLNDSEIHAINRNPPDETVSNSFLNTGTVGAV